MTDNIAVDTYSFLLENPSYRSMKALSELTRYVSRSFDKSYYETARQLKFRTVEDAHFDWITFGKTEGLEFAYQKDTLLKIILKVKDEPYLLSYWIEYHASIVGYHNIIIMDCGSKSPEFISMLRSFEDKVLILQYDKYYDHLHWVHANVAFFKLIAINCKYLTVLDVDEFLVGLRGDSVSPQHVLTHLRHNNTKIHAGTWLNNLTVPVADDGTFRPDLRIEYALDERAVKFGTMAGKLIARNFMTLPLNYIGHNLGTKEVITHFTRDSFGSIIILHLNRLPLSIVRARSLQHLRAKQALPEEMVTESEIERYLMDVLKKANVEPIIRLYIDRYLGNPDGYTPASRNFVSGLIGSRGEETHKDVGKFFGQFDFVKMLHERKIEFGLAN
jgi:hypothetical protein